MITILVANPKGGCGKTTIATGLAVAFALTGSRTVLILPVLPSVFDEITARSER